jgi:protein tyrosine phosphatase (PTP) superfamily phosphohydrolase (DUF442 family)
VLALSAPATGSTTRPARSDRRHAGLRWIAFLVAGAIVVTAALVVRHRLAPKHLLVVSEGVLYRSATLPPDQLLEVVGRYGIRTVVNLRSLEENAEPWYAAQRRALEGAGVAMVDLPMPRTTTPVPEVEARWLALLDDPAAQPILVHCQYGVLRTGIMVSVYELAHRGASSEGLFERMPQFGHDVSAPIRERIQLYLDDFARRRAAGSVGS